MHGSGDGGDGGGGAYGRHQQQPAQRPQSQSSGYGGHANLNFRQEQTNPTNANSNTNNSGNSHAANDCGDDDGGGGEFGGQGIDWSSIAVGGGSAASQTTQRQREHRAAAVPPYNPYGTSTSSASSAARDQHRSGGGSISTRGGQQQRCSAEAASTSASASSAVGLTDGAVVMSSGGDGGAASSGTPGSATSGGATSGGGGLAGGSASNAIDLTRARQNHQGGGGSAGNAQDEELRKKIEQLTNQLETKDDEIFTLQMSLASVEAEASHRTQKAEGEAANRVRLVEDRLRLVQREADSARAGLARERTKRGKGGGSGGSESGSGATNEMAEKHGGQRRGEGTQTKSGGKRVVTPPEQTAAAAANALDESMAIPARFQPIFPPDGGSADKGLVSGSGGGLRSRSQRLASHLLLSLDLLWPEEGNDAGMAPPTCMFVPFSSGEGGRPPQSKRQRRHGTVSAKHGNSEASTMATNAAGNGGRAVLTRSGAIHPGSKEADRYKAAAALRDHKQPEKVRPKEQAGSTTAAIIADGGLPAGTAAAAGARASSPDGKERAAIRMLLTHIASWDASKSASSPPSVGALVRDLIVKITSNFDDGIARTQVGLGCTSKGEDEPMAIDGAGDNSSKSEEDAGNASSRPIILSDDSWSTVVRLFVVLREVLALSSEARNVLRTWIAQTAYPDIPSSATAGAPRSITSLSTTQSRINFLDSDGTSKARDETLVEMNANVRETLGGALTLGSRVEGTSDCWDQKIVESTCGKFRDILCSAILGQHSMGQPFDVIGQSGIGRLETEACSLFLVLMNDAPSPSGSHDLGIWAVWFDELLPTAFLESSSTEPSATNPRHDLVAVLEDGSDLVGGFPRRRASKKKVRFLASRHNSRRAHNFVMEMKDFALQILLRLVNCCDDTRNRLMQGDPLARRVLAAVLDELEGGIVPLLDTPSTNSNLNRIRKITEHPLQFCLGATEYISLLSRSTEGFELLRTQMTADFSRSGGRREQLSFSGIAIMADVLRCTLTASKNVHCELNSDLVTRSRSVRDGIVSFFGIVWLQVTQSRLAEGEAESDTLLSIVDERRETFISCFSALQDVRMKKTIDADILLVVEQIMREVGYDIDEE